MKAWYMNLTAKQYWRTFQIGSVVLALGSLVLAVLSCLTLMEFLLISFLPRIFFKYLRFSTHRHEFPKEATFKTAFRYVIIALLLWFVFDRLLPNLLSVRPRITL